MPCRAACFRLPFLWTFAMAFLVYSRRYCFSEEVLARDFCAHPSTLGTTAFCQSLGQHVGVGTVYDLRVTTSRCHPHHCRLINQVGQPSLCLIFLQSPVDGPFAQQLFHNLGMTAAARCQQNLFLSSPAEPALSLNKRRDSFSPHT